VGLTCSKGGNVSPPAPLRPLLPFCLRCGKIKPKNIFPQRSGKGSPAGYVWALWGSVTSLKERENHPHFSAGLMRRAWCRNAPPHKTKSVRGAFAPQPSCFWRRPVLVGSLSFSVCSFRLLSLRPFHFATATGLHCADSRLSVILIILHLINGGYLRNPCSARARLAPLGLVLVGSTPHTSELTFLVGALNAKWKKDLKDLLWCFDKCLLYIRFLEACFRASLRFAPNKPGRGHGVAKPPFAKRKSARVALLPSPRK